MIFNLISGNHKSSFVMLMSFFILLTSNPIQAQNNTGIVTGVVKDASSKSLLQGVRVSKDSAGPGDLTLQTGKYSIRLLKGTRTLYFSLPGYQAKIINNINIRSSAIENIDIVLLPLADVMHFGLTKTIFSDSAAHWQPLVSSSFVDEKRSQLYNPQNISGNITDEINKYEVSTGTDRNTISLLRRLNGLVVNDSRLYPNMQSLQINGMGERYNQVLLNGAVFNSASSTQRAYPLELLPAEAIESITLSSTSRAFLPADFAGGTLEINTKEMPEKNFYLLQAGAGFSQGTNGKDFLGATKNSAQFTSFPGSIRSMPAGFPTTRSEVNFSGKNVQEQVDLSKTLNNNLSPVNYGNNGPDDRILIGFGKIYKTKKALKIGVIGFVNHIHETIIEESTVQVAPAVSNTLFQNFSKKIIYGQSKDLNYNSRYQLGATLNAGFYFRNNKISIKNYFGNQLNNSLLIRSDISKPAEDTLANTGLRYLSTQNKFLYSQVSGAHSFGDKNKFSIDWQATYNYNRQQNPDERNFLFRKDSSLPALFEIATPLAPAFDPSTQAPGAVNNFASNFTNSSRLWRDYTEQNFNATINLKVQLNFLGHAQILNGGLFTQSVSRDFVSDLLLVKGSGYYALDNILSPDRYFPGGLTAINYYSNIDRSQNENVFQTKRGNYFAASNISGFYFSLENRLLEKLFLQWGARLESSNRSSATIQYEYVPGLRYPQRFPIDDNTRQVHFNFLPSANLLYTLTKQLHVTGSYARTVNRPLLQEMNAYNYYDAASFMVKSGNSYLDNAIIDNFNAGVKWLFKDGTHFAFNGFYKQLYQPIEEMVTPYSPGNMLSRPYNMPSATVEGLKADVRLQFNAFTDGRLVRNITVFGSGTLLKSNVKAGPIRSTDLIEVVSHTLSGTPDYSFNAGIVIQEPHLPELLVLYDQSGDYISKVGSGNVVELTNGKSINSIPDYRVKGASRLSVQVGQKLLNARLQLVAGVANLLNSSYIIYQDLNGNKQLDKPLVVTTETGNAGYYKSGLDNTVLDFKTQRNFYVSVTYLF